VYLSVSECIPREFVTYMNELGTILSTSHGLFYKGNTKHLFCVSIEFSIETQVEVSENEKRCGNTSECFLLDILTAINHMINKQMILHKRLFILRIESFFSRTR
jgi:hypothetical protein